MNQNFNNLNILKMKKIPTPSFNSSMSPLYRIVSQIARAEQCYWSNSVAMSDYIPDVQCLSTLAD